MCVCKALVCLYGLRACQIEILLVNEALFVIIIIVVVVASSRPFTFSQDAGSRKGAEVEPFNRVYMNRQDNMAIVTCQPEVCPLELPNMVATI